MNDIGIFRDEFQRKTADGKKKRIKCLCVCPPKKPPPAPDHGGKWYDNLQDLPSDFTRIQKKDDNFKMVQEDLSKLARQLAMPATKKATTKKAPPKNKKKEIRCS